MLGAQAPGQSGWVNLGLSWNPGPLLHRAVYHVHTGSLVPAFHGRTQNSHRAEGCLGLLGVMVSTLLPLRPEQALVGQGPAWSVGEAVHWPWNLELRELGCTLLHPPLLTYPSCSWSPTPSAGAYWRPE